MRNNCITISLDLPEFIVERVRKTDEHIEIWVRKARLMELARSICRLAQRMPYTEVVEELACYHMPISNNTVRRVDQRLAGAELEA